MIKKHHGKNLFNVKGEPVRIRCFMYKQIPKPYADYITVVYTNTRRAGFPAGTVLYRSMNDRPRDPQGIGIWGEGQQWNFKAGGSSVNFSDLPEECREVVLNDYRDLWEIN